MFNHVCGTRIEITIFIGIGTPNRITIKIIIIVRFRLEFTSMSSNSIDYIQGIVFSMNGHSSERPRLNILSRAHFVLHFVHSLFLFTDIEGMYVLAYTFASVNVLYVCFFTKAHIRLQTLLAQVKAFACIFNSPSHLFIHSRFLDSFFFLVRNLSLLIIPYTRCPQGLRVQEFWILQRRH